MPLYGFHLVNFDDKTVGTERGNLTDLKHGEDLLGRRGEGGKATFKGAEIHQPTELPPVVILIEEDGEGDSNSEVKQPHVTLLLDGD